MSTTSTAPAADATVKVESATKSLVQRGVHFVKTHKKITIAVLALSGLVAANAALDKKAVVTLEPLKVDVISAPGIEVTDTSI